MGVPIDQKGKEKGKQQAGGKDGASASHGSLVGSSFFVLPFDHALNNHTGSNFAQFEDSRNFFQMSANMGVIDTGAVNAVALIRVLPSTLAKEPGREVVGGLNTHANVSESVVDNEYAVHAHVSDSVVDNEYAVHAHVSDSVVHGEYAVHANVSDCVVDNEYAVHAKVSDCVVDSECLVMASHIFLGKLLASTQRFAAGTSDV
eukprot:2791222-Amphidinium_carterae.5